MRLTRQCLLVLLLAILGIALAAAITLGTSQLVRQRIGLASEPLTAGRRLLPQVTHATPPAAQGRSTSTTSGAGQSRRSTSRTSTTPPPSTQTNTASTVAPALHKVQPGGFAEPGSSIGSHQGSDGGDSSSHRDD